jgi:chromate transporter
VKLTAALSAVTAAVVGVILNLAVWFGLLVLFLDHGGLDWFAGAIALVSFVGMVRWKWDVMLVIARAGVAGLLYAIAF